MAVTATEVARVPASQGLPETLIRYGVKYVFGMRIIQEAYPDVLIPICIHHENTATLMAYAYARVSGKVGVAAINRPGNPNALLGHERHNMWGKPAEYMDFEPGVDFAMVARGVRCEGIRVEHPSGLWPAIERGVKAGRAKESRRSSTSSSIRPNPFASRTASSPASTRATDGRGHRTPRDARDDR